MKKMFYTYGIKAIFYAFVFFVSIVSLKAQVYTDTTNLVSDLEAGLYEEYILAPASATDTFFLRKQVKISTDAVIKAQDGLGFKPVLTGNSDSKPSYYFEITDTDAGAEVQLEGIRLIGARGQEQLVSNGTFKITAENIDLIILDCEFIDFPKYNAIAKVFNSGGDIYLEDVLVYNCGGKIVQVNYKDDNSTVNYVPLIGDFTMKNSTFAKVYSRIFFELGVGDVGIDENDPNIKQRFNAGAENLTIDHCTFYEHIGVNVMQGRSKYEFAGDQSAIKGTLSITNTIFSNMDQNLNADSASITIFDHNYIAGFGAALAEGELEDFSKYNPTNTVTTDPAFVDTTNGAWDLTLQNEADLIGSDGTPIGDPRWWQGIWFPTKVGKVAAINDIAKIFSIPDKAVVQTEQLLKGSVFVYSITGQLMKRMSIESQRTEIQLNHGLYIVKVDTEIGSITRKVVISR